MRKNEKQETPSPDEIAAELVKWTNRETREKLIITINKAIETDAWEEALDKANVASIYKKGDSANLANCRPISLLQTFYKKIAALVKERIDAGLDEYITKT